MDTIYKYNRSTVRKPVSFIGIGLHTGKLTTVSLKPSIDERGIYFVRTDAHPGQGVIDANWSNVSDTILSTNLTNQYGVGVNTVEHLMSALIACGIDNVRIEVDGPEIPIMDGSAEVFVEVIKNAGKSYLKAPKQGIWIQKPVVVNDGDKYAMLMPHSVPRVSMCIDFPDTAIGAQCYSVTLEEDSYFKDIAYARTFGFAEQVEDLKEKGLAKGGSLINAIVVDGKKIVNPEGLRVENEFVRHKILDVVGDMSLAGAPIIGHYYAYKAGHSLNQKLLKKLFSQTSTWMQTSLEQGKEMFANHDDLYDGDFIQQTLNVVPIKKVAS
ncbi:MAG: UDP-3-O-[3-hydroxymyristoyl] N-acetylglucosamine deacetylase [endosymbiont of Galathealinum brachiosum]|uniref:UDP-3-O-acyl-N-acetylglucosamine deacetylase n=1 Tax=endosymbiont of Galathealinum brachiosum TaxID=2200906 RepID=A0A370DK40_9GAMM|nr:MAG: UDP-3-O-[3-hydroxymyristoyl] N-acetylglucosamine deacetylase [endosymbiont of Galathealinum brachiosum]